MIYFCADDYGLCDALSLRIMKCAEEGVLNKISVFPNFDATDISDIVKNKNSVSLHINLVEGTCMANPCETYLLADEKGHFQNTFGGLFALNIFKRKKLEEHLYKELKTQILYWKNILPENVPFYVDSHQHTHMIPAVFKVLMKVIEDEKINLGYLRIPAEPLLPYIKTPSLYITYRCVNIIKQLLLKFLWQIDKKYIKDKHIPSSYFCGVLFSGKMDEKRVKKILPEYIKMAKKNGKDIEVLFHPGYVDPGEIDFKENAVVFEKFYISESRKTEFDAVMKLSTENFD